MVPTWRLAAIFLLEVIAHVDASSRIAAWYGLRGGIVADQVVLEGGQLTYGNFSGGRFGEVDGIVNAPYGLYKSLSLCDRIDVDKDDTDELMTVPFNETADTKTPIYIGGGMFVNDHQFYTYG